MRNPPVGKANHPYPLGLTPSDAPHEGFVALTLLFLSLAEDFGPIKHQDSGFTVAVVGLIGPFGEF
jgi:hypothetical protein